MPETLVHAHAMTSAVAPVDREAFARRGRQLEIFTIVWGVLEAGVALGSAYHDHSISLAGFGWDSVIEVLSACALFWRMSHEMDHERKHRAERISLRIAGWCLLLLAAYVLVMAGVALRYGHENHPGLMGIAITSAALILMPLLARAKRQVARGLNSSAMTADAKQTNFCAIQAGIVLGGLVIQKLFHFAWADTLAALVLVPFLVRAGVMALRGQNCCAH